jgi:Ran GTPase-activating protein (RanGAP) involved in mRNA processing and transport
MSLREADLTEDEVDVLIQQSFEPTSEIPLSSLYLSQVFMHSSVRAKLLAAAVGESSPVHWLSMAHCHLTADDLKSCLVNASSVSNTLKVLDVSFNTLNNNALRTLSQLVCRLTGLEILSCDGIQMKAENLRFIAQAARRHPCFSRISLSFCGLEDAAATQILTIFKANRNISHVDLSSNKFSPEGFSELFDGLKGGIGSNLIKLEISFNNIGDLGVLALTQAINLGHLSRLEELHVRDIRASPDSVVQLIESTTKLSNLTVLDFSGNDILSTRSKKEKGRKIKGVKVPLQLGKALDSLNQHFSDAFASLIASSGGVEHSHKIQGGKGKGKQGRGRGKGKGKREAAAFSRVRKGKGVDGEGMTLEAKLQDGDEASVQLRADARRRARAIAKLLVSLTTRRQSVLSHFGMNQIGLDRSSCSDLTASLEKIRARHKKMDSKTKLRSSGSGSHGDGSPDAILQRKADGSITRDERETRHVPSIALELNDISGDQMERLDRLIQDVLDDHSK